MPAAKASTAARRSTGAAARASSTTTTSTTAASSSPSKAAVLGDISNLSRCSSPGVAPRKPLLGKAAVVRSSATKPATTGPLKTRKQQATPASSSPLRPTDQVGDKEDADAHSDADQSSLPPSTPPRRARSQRAIAFSPASSCASPVQPVTRPAAASVLDPDSTTSPLSSEDEEAIESSSSSDGDGGDPDETETACESDSDSANGEVDAAGNSSSNKASSEQAARRRSSRRSSLPVIFFGTPSAAEHERRAKYETKMRERRRLRRDSLDLARRRRSTMTLPEIVTDDEEDVTKDAEVVQSEEAADSAAEDESAATVGEAQDKEQPSAPEEPARSDVEVSAIATLPAHLQQMRSSDDSFFPDDDEDQSILHPAAEVSVLREAAGNAEGYDEALDDIVRMLQNCSAGQGRRQTVEQQEKQAAEEVQPPIAGEQSVPPTSSPSKHVAIEPPSDAPEDGEASHGTPQKVIEATAGAALTPNAAAKASGASTPDDGSPGMGLAIAGAPSPHASHRSEMREMLGDLSNFASPLRGSVTGDGRRRSARLSERYEELSFPHASEHAHALSSPAKLFQPKASVSTPGRQMAQSSPLKASIALGRHAAELGASHGPGSQLISRSPTMNRAINSWAEAMMAAMSPTKPSRSPKKAARSPKADKAAAKDVASAPSEVPQAVQESNALGEADARVAEAQAVVKQAEEALGPAGPAPAVAAAGAVEAKGPKAVGPGLQPTAAKTAASSTLVRTKQATLPVSQLARAGSSKPAGVAALSAARMQSSLKGSSMLKSKPGAPGQPIGPTRPAGIPTMAARVPSAPSKLDAARKPSASTAIPVPRSVSATTSRLAMPPPPGQRAVSSTVKPATSSVVRRTVTPSAVSQARPAGTTTAAKAPLPRPAMASRPGVVSKPSTVIAAPSRVASGTTSSAAPTAAAKAAVPTRVVSTTAKRVPLSAAGTPISTPAPRPAVGAIRSASLATTAGKAAAVRPIATRPAAPVETIIRAAGPAWRKAKVEAEAAAAAAAAATAAAALPASATAIRKEATPHAASRGPSPTVRSAPSAPPSPAVDPSPRVAGPQRAVSTSILTRSPVKSAAVATRVPSSTLPHSDSLSSSSTSSNSNSAAAARALRVRQSSRQEFEHPPSRSSSALGFSSSTDAQSKLAAPAPVLAAAPAPFAQRVNVAPLIPLSANELARLTTRNTRRNEVWVAQLDYREVRIDGVKPPSPSAKIPRIGAVRLSKEQAANARADRARKRNSDQDELEAAPAMSLSPPKAHRLGQGETEQYQSPVRGYKAKGVRWHKALFVGPSDLFSGEPGPEMGERDLRMLPTRPAKNVLSRKTYKLDRHGNVSEADHPLSPRLKRTKITIQRLRYTVEPGSEEE